ncbi:MAG: pyruvate dehydrogenase (acetyl-transferring) E1 component subunit alpha [Myxococcales bacterium]|nr:pyruvate dehydrogenase (acetyl-transferring) E1 component subunit alpha [Myxococcota bacterium]MDW8282836.1 pyruvate dehydrogenase (acetyl-transferring) E1 component subunit alpha [Myxococcales bacterium]
METTEANQVEAPLSEERTALLKELYRQMLLIRRIEEASAKAYAQGKIGGFLHLGIGQESVCVGAIAALRPTDYVVATYREHGHCIAKAGGTLDVCKRVMAELFGRDTGISHGLGGSMHLFDSKHRFLGGYGIVGGHVPLAAGVAFASKYRGEPDVTLCFFGDGSVPQGAFHEGLTLAGLWKLPVVFICENNQYAMGTPLYRTLAVPDVTERASGYAVARDRFQGDDVLQVRDRIAVAVERARTEHIPTLIEVETYRFRGHSMSDPGTYRTKEEIETWKKRDAILIARQRLVRAIGEDALVSLEASIKAQVQEAVHFAEQSPPADPARIWDHIYAQPGTDPRRM